MDNRHRRRVIKKSQKQEKRIADSVGATRHGGSGSGWVNKNDSHTDRLLIENKTVAGSKQITIKDADLTDVRRNAARRGLDPVLSFELNGRDYAIVEWDYVQAAEELYEASAETG